MDIEEIREKKLILRKKLIDLMYKFEEETDTKINKISITSWTRLDPKDPNEKPKVAGVWLEVTL